VPESYFRRQDREKWARSWGVFDAHQNAYDFKEYLKACMKAGLTPNGQFGCRIMWGTMDELIADIKIAYPECEGTDRALLEHVFGETKFIYLKREDVIAQAVSRLKAEQTGLWHVNSGDKQQDVIPLKYDAAALKAFVAEAGEHNQAWLDWFNRNEVAPHQIIYEDLTKATEKTIRGALAFLEIECDNRHKIQANNKKMSDSLSREWIEKFRKEEL